MTSPDQTVNVTVGSALTLMVDITGFNLPLTSITWMEDGQVLVNNTDNITIAHGSFEAPTTTSTLVRDPIQSPMDNGTYEVTVMNQAGQSTTTYTIIVNGRQLNFMVFSSLSLSELLIVCIYIYVAVPGRNRTLFRCVFHSHCFIPSAVAWSFR